MAIVCKREQPFIEQEVRMGRQHQTVVAIKSLVRRLTGAPGLYVASAKQVGVRYASYPTDALKRQHTTPKEPLSAARTSQLLPHSLIQGEVAADLLFKRIFSARPKVIDRNRWRGTLVIAQA
jgi:hypothetical protein